MKPYYQADGITIYHARMEDVLDAGLVPVREVALIHVDPPYGNGADTRVNHAGGRTRRNTTGCATAKTRNYPAVAGNDMPYDPDPLLILQRPTVMWGGNHYASRLPDSTAWLVWDKRDGNIDTGSDAELAWTNLGGALRCFYHVWRGLARASECGVIHMHPTQKPIALGPLFASG